MAGKAPFSLGSMGSLGPMTLLEAHENWDKISFRVEENVLIYSISTFILGHMLMQIINFNSFFFAAVVREK